MTNTIKILHVNYLPSNIVVKEKKIQEMADAALMAKLPIHFLVLNDTIDSVSEQIEFRRIGLPKNNKLKKIFQMLFRYIYLYRHLREEQFDILVLRYPLAMGFGANRFYKKFGHKTFTEHHTNEVAELRKIWKNKKLGLFVSYWEHWRKKKYLSQCLGVIGVTSEIALHENSYVPSKPFFKFPNGAHVNAIPFSGISNHSSGALKVLFIAGRFAPWHGLDRVLRGLEEYTGDKAIELMLVGNLNDISHGESISRNNNSKVNIVTYGQLHEPDLTKVCSEAHIAISSLGIHRVGLTEASVLKTREYMARGIPFIYSYNDSDLSGDEPYAYSFPSDDSPIDFTEVVNFYNNYQQDKNISITMRTQAEQVLDWSVKLEKLIAFLMKSR